MNQLKPVPSWFWISATLALIWNLLGVMAYIQQVTLTPETLAAMEEAERMLYENTPAWATAAFAISVFGGAAGCVLLLFKKGVALILFIASFLGVLVQMGHAFFLSQSFEVFGPGGMVMPIMVIMIAIALIWFTRSSKEKGWIS